MTHAHTSAHAHAIINANRRHAKSFSFSLYIHCYGDALGRPQCPAPRPWCVGDSIGAPHLETSETSVLPHVVCPLVPLTEKALCPPLLTQAVGPLSLAVWDSASATAPRLCCPASRAPLPGAHPFISWKLCAEDPPRLPARVAWAH